MKLLRKKLILNPSSSETRGMIYIPDRFQDAATACQVINAGPDVNPVVKPGEIVLCKTGFAGRINNKIFGDDTFWCEEDNIYGIMKNNIIFPLGNTILLRRDTSDSMKNGILIPELRRSQSLTATVLRFGMTRKPFKVNGINPGMKVRLTEWQEWMIQIELEDGSEGLIVREQDLLYCYEDSENKIQH